MPPVTSGLWRRKGSWRLLSTLFQTLARFDWRSLMNWTYWFVKFRMKRSGYLFTISNITEFVGKVDYEMGGTVLPKGRDVDGNGEESGKAL
jgi:hypothetical protein